MAGGGIVAFGGGGEIPGYADKGLVESLKDVYNMTPEEIKEAAKRRLRGMSATETLKGVKDAASEKGSKSYLQSLKALGGKALGPLAFAGDALFGTSDAELKTLREADARRAMQGMPESTVKGFSDTIDLDKMIESEAAKAAPIVVLPDGKLNTGPGVGAGAGAGAGTNKRPPVAAPATGTPALGPNTFQNQVNGISALLPAKEAAPVKNTFMAEREAISKPVYEKAEGMINKEKDRLNEGKEQDFYMALIEGGLAAAGASGPNALQNLAQGFGQGAKSYAGALRDFRKASQENSKMELDIERARAAEKRGDMDSFQKYEDSIKNRNADIDKLKTQGIFALQNVHTSGQYQQQAAATTAAAQIRAAQMPGAQERLFASLGGGDVVKGLKVFQEAQADKTGAAYAQMYAKHIGDAAEKNYTAKTPEQFALEIQQLFGAMQGGGFQAQPTNTTVRTLPPAK
jgi:hypothetical protein